MTAETNDAMRILVLTEMYPRKTNPTTGIFVHRECLALRRAGLDIRVISPLPYSPRILWMNPKWRDLGIVPRSDTWDGIPVRYPRYPRPPGAFYRKFDPFAIFPTLCVSFRQWSRERRFDIIHAHGLLPCGMAAVLLSKAFGLPCVCHARGSDVNLYPWESRANFLLTRYVIENCDAPVATSKALAERMSSMSRKHREMTVLYKSVNTELFSPSDEKASLRWRLGLQPQSFVVIFVGRLESDKGCDDLVEAWEPVVRETPGAVLVLVGEGQLPNKLCAFSQSVRCCGRKPEAEVALWMQASDILVLPSRNEGLPNVVLEAMACGLPVVATPVGGIPEAVVDGETGLLVPVGDRQALASSILALAENRDLRRSMGEAGRKRAQAVFRWDKFVSDTCELYGSVMRTGAERQKSAFTAQRT